MEEHQVQRRAPAAAVVVSLSSRQRSGHGPSAVSSTSTSTTSTSTSTSGRAMRPSHTAVLLLVWAGVAVCRAAPAPGPEASLEAPAGAASPTKVGTSNRVGGGMSMQMTFFGGNDFKLWFNAFHVHDAGTLTITCLGVAVMAALYEGLKVFRIILVDRIDSSSFTSKGHWLQVFLHIVQVTCSYFLMLATMTYSTWVMMAVCAGAGLGYAVFALMVPKSTLFGGATEHCH